MHVLYTGVIGREGLPTNIHVLYTEVIGREGLMTKVKRSQVAVFI